MKYMTKERWEELVFGPDPQKLTAEELAAGYHFCPDYDDDVRGPEEGCESEPCACGKPGAVQPVYDFDLCNDQEIPF